MKKFLAIMAMILMLGGGISQVFAASLVCDPQVGVTQYRIEVDGTIVETNYPAEANGSVRYNVDHLADGQYHSFRLWAIDQSGWPSDPSQPFDARKPTASGNVRIGE